MAWPAVQSRFEYRGSPEVRVVAVRVSSLRAPHNVPETRRYQGCVSWVELDAPLDVSGAEPVLPLAELAGRIASIGAALGPADGAGR